MATTTTAERWVDPKRYLWLLSLVALAFPFIGYGLYRLTGYSICWWFTPLIVYGTLPAFDYLVGSDTSNPPEEAIPELEQRKYYRYTLYAALPIQYAVFFWGCYTAARGGLTTGEWIGLVLSVGIVTGLAINTAHELGHSSRRFERWLAKLSLAPGFYGHFFVEHNRGHHSRVSTPEDPASARFGESFYEFYFRCVVGSVRSAINIERVRLNKVGQSFWSPQNELLQGWTMSLLIWLPVLAWLGWGLLPFMLIQAIFGGSLLENVNYLEHYGLCRERLPNGKYERCQPKHSWNSNHIVTNVFLFHLQRHSDHHATPARSYQALRHFEECPQLPSGYAAMMIVAYCPPIWFRVMNPRVVKHCAVQQSIANVKPSMRNRVLTRYGLRSI